MSEVLDDALRTALTAFATDDGAALLVALDFDGVLAPLVDDPAASRMTAGARAAVDRIGALAAAHGTNVRLAFVSGRDLDDLALLAEPPAGAYVVGSHGAQTGRATPDGLDSVPLTLTDEQATTLGELTAALDEAVAGRPGAWVQRKPSAAVLHTRQAGPEDTAAAVAAADAAATRLGLEAMHGKDVVETAVLHTSKGEALGRLRRVVAEDLAAPAVRVLYAGDDTTDEKAFAVLGDGDVTVKVGPGETLADQRVTDPEAVAALLGRLADLIEGDAGS
ncbi:trehalose-phosphatase [Isoptericola halotolerans]|uniref:Trehalose 6-phosphate phosphatase n=1 Tax=Isoptericola halotolerans TaxID=300560 RepID=A0ABX2A3X2_9MICO|nr:trehalose-phosphatase [Isoptericola halotolerans]NOV97271.1 trehalose-phosphatase [Isoptericola halotolerans]